MKGDIPDPRKQLRAIAHALGEINQRVEAVSQRVETVRQDLAGARQKLDKIDTNNPGKGPPA